MQINIILAAQSTPALLACIKSIAAASYNPAHINILVVDITAEKSLQAAVQAARQQHAHFAGLSYLAMQKAAGLPAAYNFAAQNSSCEYMLFLNVALQLDKQALAQLQSALQRWGENAAALECRTLPCETQQHINPVTLEMHTCTAGALLLSREAFAKVGGFDTGLGIDNAAKDLSWRLRAAGYALRYVPLALAYSAPAAAQGEGPAAHAGPSAQGDGCTQSLGEYAAKLQESLLLHYKFGGPGDICRGNRQYLAAIRRPQHFAGVRRRLLKNYGTHFLRLWHFLFWRLKNMAQYRKKTAMFAAGAAPLRGLCQLQRPVGGPLVTVVVRTCGRPATLRQSLLCLKNQTYPNFEVIVSEDGPAASKTMVENEFKDLNIRYYCSTNKVGRGKAGNIGLAHALGEFVNFLDDDDYFYPEHLELLVAQLLKNPQADMVTAASVAMEAELLCAEPYQLGIKNMFVIRYDRMDVFQLCQTCLMPIQSVMFKRSLYLKYGGLHQGINGNEDWYMWLKYFSVAQRIPGKGVDIKRATSLFTVPHGEQAAQTRRLQYRQYEDIMLDAPDISFSLSPRQMRQFYQDFIADMLHLKNQGKLEQFLNEEAKRTANMCGKEAPHAKHQ